MKIPTFVLERKKLPRLLFSFQSATRPGQPEIVSLMRRIYDLGVSHFDLPSLRYLESFRELRRLIEDETLLGLGHIEAEVGASFFGKPLHLFEEKVVATMIKNLFPPYLIRNFQRIGLWNEKLFFRVPSSREVFTQKEIDRLSFDAPRFDRALSSFHPQESPFLVLGGSYTDWLLALGRVDLLKEMVFRISQRDFIPILGANWATFALPKAKVLDVAAYAVPINSRWGLFDLDQAARLIKKFDRPVISLNPLDDGRLLDCPEDAFAYLFDDLKIHGAIAEVASDAEVERLLKALRKIPSLIPPRKT